MNIDQAMPALVPPPIRSDGRAHNQLRSVAFKNSIAPNAHGSTLVEWGNTRVICAVTVEETVPRWMKEQGVVGGWLTSEYSMLPYSTHQRKPRDISKGKIDGRSQEIQRLIGRSLRAAIDLKAAGSRTFWIDCDVLQADGGTRTAAITGSFVALTLAVHRLMGDGLLTTSPIRSQVAAVSVGLLKGVPLLDLNYLEDSSADVDLNLVMNSEGRWIEIQGTGEHSTFSTDDFSSMVLLGSQGIRELHELQCKAISEK